jgi:four helix bundle protein
MNASRPDIKQRSYLFAGRVVRLCKHLETARGTGRTMGNQLLRSGTSIGANIEEAYGGHSRADFIAKTVIAMKEARETHYWLRLLADTDTVPPARLSLLVNEANQIVAILTTIIIRARANNPTSRF